MARTRFGRDRSVAIAFLLALITIRSLAYLLVILSQYPGSEATRYFAASGASVVAAWIALTTFSLHQLRIRAEVGRFLHGVENAGRYHISWFFHAVVWRIPSIAVVGYLGLLQIASALRSHYPSSRFAGFGFCLLAVGLASVVLIHRALRNIRSESKGVSEVVALFIAVLAIGGPDFRIDDGSIHPVYFGVVLDDTNAFLFLLLPAALALGLTAQILGTWIRRYARREIWGAFPRVPLLAAFLRNQSIGTVLAVAAISVLLSTALPRLGAATAAAAVATIPWLVRSARYLRVIRADWRIDGSLTSLVRQSRRVTMIGFAAYLVVALAFAWWT